MYVYGLNDVKYIDEIQVYKKGNDQNQAQHWKAALV